MSWFHGIFEQKSRIFVFIFSRALLFNWKYFLGWNLVRMTCRRPVDDMRMTREWDFRRDFTGRQHMSSARHPHIICMSSACRPHIVRKRACRPYGMATALHKAYWLPFLNLDLKSIGFFTNNKIIICLYICDLDPHSCALLILGQSKSEVVHEQKIV